MAIAQFAHGGEPSRRRHDVATFALDRLDEDRRHVARIGELLEQDLLDVVGAGQSHLAVRVPVRGVVAPRRQGAEAGALAGLAGGQ